jgi:CheY-like chemotaxis protein
MRTPAILPFTPPAQHTTRVVTDLEAELVRVRAELADARAQLARTERLESVGAITGGIAHDLNNVLTPILMAIALLDEQITDADTRRVLSVLHDSARRGATMVQQILALARGMRRTPVTTSLRRALEDLRRIVAETFPHAIQPVVEMASDVRDLTIDPGVLHGLLMDLCNDARASMPGGGVLTLRADNVELSVTDAAVRGVAPGTYVAITVSDMRASTSLDERATALGAHGGFLTRQSEMGRGHIARVFLPAAAPAGDRTGDLDAGELPHGRQELILVVDDELSVRSITASVLSTHGYRVVTAANGAEAVAEFARHAGAVAAVLTDIRMPVMDGAHTIRALRTIDPQVKLIAATGVSGAAAELDPSHRVAAVIAKPFRADTLLRVIRQVLDR